MNSTEALHEAYGDQRYILESLKQQSEILKILVIGYQEFQEGKRAEPAYSQVARTIGQRHQTSEAAEKDLRAEGIENSIILKHQHLINEWLETVILASTEDPEDDDATFMVGSSTAVDDDTGSRTSQGLSMDESTLLPFLVLDRAKKINKIQQGHRRLTQMYLKMKLSQSPVRAALVHIEANQVAGTRPKLTKLMTMQLQ